MIYCIFLQLSTYENIYFDMKHSHKIFNSIIEQTLILIIEQNFQYQLLITISSLIGTNEIENNIFIFLINLFFSKVILPFHSKMNRKTSFQSDLSQSIPSNYSLKYPSDFFNHKQYDRYNDKVASRDSDKKQFEETHYTTAKHDFSGIRKLPDHISNVRQTFSYVSPMSSKRYDQQISKIRPNNYNSDFLRQTMDLKSLKRKHQINFQRLQRSVSGNLNFTQAYIQSQNLINDSLTSSRSPNRYNKNTGFGSHDYISNKYSQFKKTQLEQQIQRLKEQRQKQNLNPPKLGFIESPPFARSFTNITHEQTNKFAKKNYVEYYTPKISKKKSNQSLATNEPYTPSYNRLNKQTTFDTKIQQQTPKKTTDMKTVKLLTLQRRQSKQFKPRKSFNEKVSLQDFILGKSLGQGRFGTVHLAFHKSTGGIFAMKKVKKQVIKSNKMVDQFILEIKLQSYLNHPFIVKIFGLFDDEQYIYIILQFLDQGSLYNYLKKFKKLPQQDVAQKIRYLSQSIKYLQDRGIAHRDIKPQNIILTNDVCKLADFGWATFCDEERRKTYCGTCDYVAPQILQGQQYDETVDLWCIGVLTYQLLTGKAPFYHMSQKQTMKKIINTTVQYPENFSQQAKSFIEGLIKKNPLDRMSIQEILNHEFISKIKLSE